MDDFANLAPSERYEIITETAIMMGVDATIIEKDFWVCWMLKLLFSLPPGHARLVFKGGTSLSKAYDLIRRFSEDIDVVTALDYFLTKGIADPSGDGISKSERLRRMEALDLACAQYVGGDFMTELQRICSKHLRETSDWELSIDASDRYGHTLLFRYPVSSSMGVHTYIRDRVKIELGWRSATEPHEERTFRSYVAEHFPSLMSSPDVKCRILSPVRTFWEKVTALHAESFRDEVPHFFSRHYSDVAVLYHAGIMGDFTMNIAMLDEVRRYKQRYYPSAWAHYELAVPGTLVVVPGARKLRALESDYRDMRMMFFEPPPRFDKVVNHLRDLEDTLNA